MIVLYSFAANVWVKYISIKVNDQPQGNLKLCPSDYYDSNSFLNLTPQDFRNVLENLKLLKKGF